MAKNKPAGEELVLVDTYYIVADTWVQMDDDVWMYYLPGYPIFRPYSYCGPR
jgi:hypothetical protein